MTAAATYIYLNTKYTKATLHTLKMDELAVPTNGCAADSALSARVFDSIQQF